MANPTSNFGWQMPTSTDLVTDLPADFETFGQAVDTSLADLKGGTTGQILSKTSNTDMDFTWITNDIGDITAVTAGTGLTGGGTTGAVTVSLDLTAANVYTAAQTATRYIVTGSTVATNGMYLSGTNTLAFSTNSILGIQINATQDIGLGTSASALSKVTVGGTAPVTSNSSYGLHNTAVFASTATTVARSFYSNPSTAAATYTISTFRHYEAAPLTIGAGATVTEQIAFRVGAITGATNNWGFFGGLNVSGTANYNLYMSGTAHNYLQGRTGIGAGITSSTQFGVTNAQSTADVTVLTRNFAAQTADSLAVQNSASSTVWGVTAAGFMKYSASNTATTVGAAGAASALPANPTGYLKIDIGGTEYKVPYYAA